MKQIVKKYDGHDVADSCNVMIKDGWQIKFMVCYRDIYVLVTFEHPLLDTTDTGPI